MKLQALEERLLHPDNSRRSVQIIHSYFPKTPAEVAVYLDRAAENGLGGFCVNMDGAHYLGEGTPTDDEVWEALRYFIEECHHRGFSVWIYDEKAYPSGAANRLVLDGSPDFQVKGLLCRTFLTDGGIGEAELDEAVPFPDGIADPRTLPVPVKVRSSAAYPLQENGVLRSSAALPVEVRGNRIFWNLPAGAYRIAVCYTRAVNFLTENKVPYVDLMRSDVTARFIEVTHEAYRRHLGDETIGKITAFFTDEPGLPVHGCSSYFYEKNAVAPWTEEMDTLLPDLDRRCIQLFFPTEEDNSAFRRRYWQTAGTLFAKHYFGAIAAWCKSHNTQMTGHLYGEETLSMQLGLNADLFGLMREMQAPGVDRLYCAEPETGEPLDVTAEKTASSAAHLYGRDMVMSENSYHLEHNWWRNPESATAEARLNSAYYQIQLGLTNVASYFPYSPVPDEERRAYEVKAARAAEFCSMGQHIAPVLVLIPLTAAAERFTVPDHKYWNVGPCIVAPHQPKPVQVIEEAYGEVLRLLEDGRYDFDLIDEVGLARDVSVEGTRLTTGYETYQTLVLFDDGLLSDDCMDKILQFAAAGGTITAVNTDRPTEFLNRLSEAYPNALRWCDFREITANLAVEPVIHMTENPSVRVKKSLCGGLECWFLHNRSASDAVLTVYEAGEFTIYTADMEKTTVNSAEAFPLTLPAREIRMLVRTTGERREDAF